MPAPSRAALEQAVIDALPADDSSMSYEALVGALNTSGNWAAVQYLRTMKRQGRIVMRVYMNDSGQLVHEVTRGGV